MRIVAPTPEAARRLAERLAPGHVVSVNDLGAADRAAVRATLDHLARLRKTQHRP
jgi:hypothetical protein